MTEFSESSRQYFEVLYDENLSSEALVAVAGLERDIARQAEIIREKDRLVEEANDRASTDALTGLSNRRAFDNDLKLLAQDLASMNIHRQAEPHEQFSRVLILGDLDFFKLVNDVLGYEYGDTILAIVADLLKRSMRHDDLVYRLGGDEFAAIILVKQGKEDDAFRSIKEKFYLLLDELRGDGEPTPELEALQVIGISFAHGIFIDRPSSVDDLMDTVNTTMRRVKSIKEAKGTDLR